METAGPWQPANPAEAALADALARDDHERYVTVLAESVLLVPIAAPEPGADPTLAAATLDTGQVVIVAHTSPEAMARPEAYVTSEHHLPMPFTSLARGWPDPQWLLAVDPGLPVAGNLAGAELPGVVHSVFAPVNDVERELSMARRPGQALAALAVADLHLPVVPGTVARDPADPQFPWWTEESGVEGQPPVVPVFTSVERLRGCLGLAHPELESVTVDLLALADHWPQPHWLLSVNPGAPFEVSLTGEQLRAVGERMPEVLGAQLSLQVLVPRGQLPVYLEQGYGKAAGVVHLVPAQPLPLPQLYEELGVLRPGSPFTVDDESTHVIRWQPEPEVGAGWVRDPAPRTQTVELPAQAQLVTLDASGNATVVATYEPTHLRWTSAS